jgi:hypothetical protein
LTDLTKVKIPCGAGLTATVASPIDTHVARAIHQTHTRPQDEGEERREPADEPTQLERLIAAQFRRGIATPLTPVEQQQLMKMSLEQRCDYIAKVVVWTAKAVQRHILEHDK